MCDTFGAGRALRRLFALFDIGRRPDGVEGLVQAQTRIDVAREFVGLGHDGFQRRADERVAMRLTAGEGTGVAAKEWQVRGKFLATGHDWVFSMENTNCAVFRRRVRIVATLEGTVRMAGPLSPQRC